MRRHIKTPRILKINWIHAYEISVVFNNGESRIIDFKRILSDLDIDQDSPAALLLTPAEFAKVRLENNTLSWHNVEQVISAKNGGKVSVPFEIGADVLLGFSEPDASIKPPGIGRIIKDARVKSGLTQQELAIKSGTTRNYISRIENDKSDIEIATLRKIIETGLGKELQIVIK